MTRVLEEVRDLHTGVLADTAMVTEEVIEAVEHQVREGTPEEEPDDIGRASCRD